MSTASQALPHTNLIQMEPFSRLEAAPLALLLRAARVVRVNRGERVACPGVEAGDALWWVLEGEVRLALTAECGTEKVLELATEGDGFGEECLANGHSRLWAVAGSDACLLSIGRDTVRDAMRLSPYLAERLLSRLALRMSRMVENLELCLERNSARRVAGYLARQAPAGHDSFEMRLPADKQTIAAHLGLTPETLSRVLSRFARDGAIRPRGRRGLLITSLASLRAGAN